MWTGSVTSLKDIYNDLISIYAQLSDIHDKFLMLTSDFYKGENKDILPQWALDESDRIQGEVGKLTSKLWEMPEVNKI